MITVKSLRAAQALPYINELARLRITVFRAFPYLYLPWLYDNRLRAEGLNFAVN